MNSSGDSVKDMILSYLLSRKSESRDNRLLSTKPSKRAYYRGEYDGYNLALEAAKYNSSDLIGHLEEIYKKFNEINSLTKKLTMPGINRYVSGLSDAIFDSINTIAKATSPSIKSQ